MLLPRDALFVSGGLRIRAVPGIESVLRSISIRQPEDMYLTSTYTQVAETRDIRLPKKVKSYPGLREGQPLPFSATPILQT
jgi:hypothetical protein